MRMDKKIIVLKELQGNPEVQLYGLQKIMQPYVNEIKIFWWTLWFAVITFLIFKLAKEFISKQNKQTQN